jgi:hypothetical protein
MDNPPAFPSPVRGPAGSERSEEGMTLRDWFAGQVLTGFAASVHANKGSWDDATVAKCCFEVADAMLAARGDA